MSENSSALSRKSKRALELSASSSVLQLCAMYDIESERQLDMPDVALGAIVDLPPVSNPALIDVKLAFGERAAVSWLLPHVTALNAASAATNVMDEAAVLLCCRDIIRGFPWLTLGEFCVFCSRFRTHRYVEKRSDYIFSPDIIMQGLREYSRDRFTEIDRYRRQIRKPYVPAADAVTWEEYCRMNKIKEGTPSPLSFTINDSPRQALEK